MLDIYYTDSGQAGDSFASDEPRSSEFNFPATLVNSQLPGSTSPCILVKEAVRIKESLQKKCCHSSQPPKIANTMSLEIYFYVFFLPVTGNRQGS